MNTLFILGNGFDLNLGLKTSFNDFYKYYNDQLSSSENIKILKQSILDDFNNWSDMELSLGQYLDRLNTTEEFDEIFEDILKKLSNYLKNEEKKFIDSFNSNKQNLIKNLISPELSLTDIEYEKLSTYKRNILQNNNINIITFNYTKSLEYLLDYLGKPIPIGHNNAIQNIYHIHGYIDDKMILGVNDISQISNKTFHDNLDIKDAFIKQQCNQASGHTIDIKCEGLVNSANLICIFGSSMGRTDNKWWELIGARLIHNQCKLIIFEVVDDISQLIEYKKERIRRRKKIEFLNKTVLSDEEKLLASENIFIGLNTNMFSDICKWELS